MTIKSSSNATPDDLIVIGHRGTAGLLPENTLAGFKKALELGVDAIELDIHLTSDNEAVVYHDPRLNPAITRDANGKWIKKRHLIKDLKLLKVQSFDVGKLNHREEYAKKYPQQKSIDGEHIPTLRDVIQLVKKTDHKTLLFIELKLSPLKAEETKSSEKIAKVVAKIIRDENISDSVTIISFDWKILSYFQKIMPDIPTGYVTTTRKDRDTVQKNQPGVSPWMAGIDIDEFDSIPKAVNFAGGSYWICNYHHATGDSENITSEMVDKAHAIGIKVVAWTPDSKSEMKKLIKTGVDGITTNRPDILLSVLKKDSSPN